MEEESREGMLEYQEDWKGLHRADLWSERLEYKILSSNINFSHRINYYNSLDIINKLKSQLLRINYCTITGKMHIFTNTWCGNREDIVLD